MLKFCRIGDSLKNPSHVSQTKAIHDRRWGNGKRTKQRKINSKVTNAKRKRGKKTEQQKKKIGIRDARRELGKQAAHSSEKKGIRCGAATWIRRVGESAVRGEGNTQQRHKYTHTGKGKGTSDYEMTTMKCLHFPTRSETPSEI